MAKLASLRRDKNALTNGVWIKPDPTNFPDLELLVRGKDAAFYDALSLRYRELVRAAREAGALTARQGLNDLVPSAVQQTEDSLMLDRLLLDVRGLDGEGGEITVAGYRRMAVDEEYRPMLDLAREAVAIATDRRAADAKAAEGNSAMSSATAPNGVAPPT
jgi:hypothetical protein